MRDENGEEMHKSKGNAIWFDDAAEKMGVDVMRWLFSRANPAPTSISATTSLTRSGAASFCRSGTPILLRHLCRARWLRPERTGRIDPADRAPVAGPLDHLPAAPADRRGRQALDDYDSRRPRGRSSGLRSTSCPTGTSGATVGASGRARTTPTRRRPTRRCTRCLTTLARLLAPFMPFLAEAMYQNLVRSVDPQAPESVHLTDFPISRSDRIDESLSRDMDAVLEVVGAGHAARQEAAIKVRQPLPALLIHTREPEMLESVLRLRDQILDELNVKSLRPMDDPGQYVSYTIRPNLRSARATTRQAGQRRPPRPCRPRCGRGRSPRPSGN